MEVQYPPPIMRDQKEAVPNTEGESRNREEVHSSKDFAMVFEKGSAGRQCTAERAGGWRDQPHNSGRFGRSPLARHAGVTLRLF